MFRIKAAVGGYAIKNFELWQITPVKSKTIYLDENTSFEEVGAIFAGMSHELKIPQKAVPEIALQTIIERSSFPEGGLYFISDDNGVEKIISTGCCFGGVKSWQDLFDVTDSERFVWLGHSTMPEIERLPDGVIRIWANGEAKNSKNFFFEATKKEFKSKILELEKDLIDFTVLLELWAEQVTQTKAKEIVKKFGFAPHRFAAF